MIGINRTLNIGGDNKLGTATSSLKVSDENAAWTKIKAHIHLSLHNNIALINLGFHCHARDSASTEKERVALCIPPPLGHVLKLFANLEFFPYTGGIDVFILLIPSPVNHFCQYRVIVPALQVLPARSSE